MSLHHPRKTLRSRLLLASLAVEVVMLTLLVGNSVRLVDEHLVRQAEARIAANEVAFKTAVAVPLASRDYATLRDILDGWQRAGDISYLAVTDVSGRVLASSGWDSRTPLPEESRGLATGGVAHVGFAVDYLGQTYGRVRYGLSMDFLTAARRDLFTQSAVIAGAEIVLSILLLSLIAYLLTRRLVRLAEASGRIAEGDYATRLAVSGDDEVAVVAANFNAMAEAVESRIVDLNFQARHDPLTGLHNRRSFESELSFALLERQTSPVFLLYVDLDQFKVINDTCGHAAGDLLLQSLARLMMTRFHFEGSMVARLGGDEFGFIMRGVGQDEALDRARRLVDEIRALPFVWEGRPFRIGASVGVVRASDELDTVASLLIAADTACYAAKERGRNRIEVYQPGDAWFEARRAEFGSLPEITAALEENRFVLHHQRIQALRPGNLDSAEVLVRMVGRDGCLIPPSGFIPAAERYNLMGFIDRWVIDAALRQEHQWASSGREMPFHHLAINVSGASLGDARLREFLREKLGEYSTDPRRLCFEITESCAISSVDQALEFIDLVRSFGAAVSLDDFGSGLSSFGYLKRFRADYLKIDGQFVRNLEQDRTDRSVVEAMVKLARAHDLRSVAEFVVSPPLIDIVRDLGVDFAQGYAVHEPSPLAAA